MRVWCSRDLREKNCNLNPGRGIRDRMGPHAPSLRPCAPLALPSSPSIKAMANANFEVYTKQIDDVMF